MPPDFVEAMKVRIQLLETSQPLEHDAINTYTKGPFYCVSLGESVVKYPLSLIWRVVEDYGPHTAATAECRSMNEGEALHWKDRALSAEDMVERLKNDQGRER